MSRRLGFLKCFFKIYNFLSSSPRELVFACLLFQRKHSYHKSGCAFSSEKIFKHFPGSNSRYPRCDLPCKFFRLTLSLACDLKKRPSCLHVTFLCVFLWFCVGYEYTGFLLSLLISTLYFIHMYISILKLKMEK